MSRQPHHKGSILKWEGNSRELRIWAKDLNIVWGNDSRYWRVPTEGDGPAELIQVTWLEVSGGVKVEKNKKYRVEFDVAVKEDGFGWNNIKALVIARAGRRGTCINKKLMLTAGFSGKIPNPESDALEIDMRSEDQLSFGLYEVWSGKWKGGLEIKSAKITKILNDDDLRLAKITKNVNDDDLRRAKATENVNDDDLPPSPQPVIKKDGGGPVDFVWIKQVNKFSR